MATNFVTSLLDINYDLIHDVVEDEPIPALKHFALSRITFTLWKKNIIGKLKETPNADFRQIFGDYVRCNDWFRQIENDILNNPHNGVKNCLPFSKKYLPYCFYEEFKEFISKMKNNLAHFSNLLCKVNMFVTSEIVEIYVRNMHLTLQGTVNFKKTALYLVENSNLTSMEKYAISCYYCLKEKIYNLSKEIKEKDILKKWFFNEDFRLMIYWTYQHQNIFDELDSLTWQMLSNLNITNEFLNFIIKGNEVAVQSIWENLKSLDVHIELDISESLDLSRSFNLPESFNISDLFTIYRPRDLFRSFHGNGLLDACKVLSLFRFNNFRYVNMWCYFISQLNSIDLIRKLCVFKGYLVLYMLGSDSRWNSYFLASSEKVLVYLSQMNVHYAIKTIIVCWLYNTYERETFKTLLLEEQSFLNFEIQNFIFSSETILRMIVAINSRRVLNRLLTLETNDDLKMFFDEEFLLFQLIDYLLRAGALYLLKDLVKELFSAPIAEKFMHRFAKKISVKFCLRFLSVEVFAKMADTFFIYCCGMREYNGLKGELPFKEDGKIIGDILKSNDDNKLPMINNFLNWCFNGNKEAIFNCKMNLFDLEEHPNRYCTIQLVNLLMILKKRKRSRMVKKHLKWAIISEKVFENFCNMILNDN